MTSSIVAAGRDGHHCYHDDAGAGAEHSPFIHEFSHVSACRLIMLYTGRRMSNVLLKVLTLSGIRHLESNTDAYKSLLWCVILILFFLTRSLLGCSTYYRFGQYQSFQGAPTVSEKFMQSMLHPP